VESGEWRVESGEWRVESGKWKESTIKKNMKRLLTILAIMGTTALAANAQVDDDLGSQTRQIMNNNSQNNQQALGADEYRYMSDSQELTISDDDWGDRNFGKIEDNGDICDEQGYICTIMQNGLIYKKMGYWGKIDRNGAIFRKDNPGKMLASVVTEGQTYKFYIDNVYKGKVFYPLEGAKVITYANGKIVTLTSQHGYANAVHIGFAFFMKELIKRMY